MSNTSIAMYPGKRGMRCAEHLQGLRPEWRVVLNPLKHDADANVLVMENEQATAVWLSFPQHEDYQTYQHLAAVFGCFWMQVMFQEHLVWEYLLYDAAGKVIDSFQPLPQIWGKESGPTGDAEMVARLWQIPPAKIQRYLKPWTTRL